MSSRKALQLAVSTLILLILGVLLLFALTYALTDGFKKFKNTSGPFADTAQVTAIKTNCQNACEQQQRIIYCCSTYQIDNNDIKCNDNRLELDCSLSCDDFDCGTSE